MKEKIALLVAVVGLAMISAQGQSSFAGYPTGFTVVEYYNETGWQNIGCEQQVLFVPGTVFPVDNFSVSTVPEPSTLGLCAIGLAGLTVARRSFRPKA